MAGIIQRDESDQYGIPFFYLFCGQKIFDPDNLDTPFNPLLTTKNRGLNKGTVLNHPEFL